MFRTIWNVKTSPLLRLTSNSSYCVNWKNLSIYLSTNIYICNHEYNVPSRLSPQWLCGSSCTWAHNVRIHHVPKCMSCHKAIVVITGRAHCFHDYIYILRPSCFCEIWALCVSWITYDHFYIYKYIYNIYIHICIHIYMCIYIIHMYIIYMYTCIITAWLCI